MAKVKQKHKLRHQKIQNQINIKNQIIIRNQKLNKVQ